MSELELSETDRYAYPHRVLHWLVAAVLLLSLASGLTLGFLGFEGAMERLGRAGTDFLYTSHKSLGVALLALMTLRVMTRLLYVVPDHDPPLHPFQRILSTAVHHLLYLALLAQPMLGWAATASGDFPVQFLHWHLPGIVPVNEALSERLFEWHGWLGWVILGLITLHISGALYHWLIRRDGVMARMSLFDPDR
ncbi:cytochrome b [Halomonas alkalicola]|mgnify:CR=1 FL=1|uniref:Cytochrome b/b6 domain-containing protein n=1 Tax=Halomonas alkalicola TaxID=1930622 RepID=A0ABY9H862_9GAMM|nr:MULTISPECIES: cytochrome b/b6 domain-containing protein [Halomonas]WLI74383.1 cytochrome b/b6 domain-containing protein [Halomonas alkalicola]